jgi:hypothetical protein
MRSLCLFLWLESPVGLGRFFEVPWSHSDTQHSVGLLWTSDRPIAGTSTWQHSTITRDRHPCARIRTTIPSKWTVVDLHIRPRGPWDRYSFYVYFICYYYCGSAAQRGLWPLRPRSFLITHNDAPQSVGLFWTSDQLVAETSTWQHTTHTSDNIHDSVGIRIHDRSRRTAVDLRLRPRGHWDQHNNNNNNNNNNNKYNTRRQNWERV